MTYGFLSRQRGDRICEPLATGAASATSTGLAAGRSQTAEFDEGVIATGHDWPALRIIGEAESSCRLGPIPTSPALPAGRLASSG